MNIMKYQDIMAALELFEHLYPTMVWKQEEMKNLIFRYIRHFGTFQTEVKTNYHRDTAHKTDWFYQDIWSPYNQSLQMDIALEGFSSLSLSRWCLCWVSSGNDTTAVT